MRSKDKGYYCGILLPLASLPSDYGIGTLGKEAYGFIDFLKDCNQNYWQLLPLCPLGKGNSPYSSDGCFAGEILYIDLPMLINDGLLEKNDLMPISFTEKTDYDTLREYKLPILKKAAARFNKSSRNFINFKRTNRYWLHDYALFKALAESLSQKEFVMWPDDFKYRLPIPLREFEEQNTELISFYEITQFIFWLQFSRLKAYSSKSGIKLIGDIPFYVAGNSSDVWQNPDCFCLNRDMTASEVAGVPPDIFAALGQLWGNPVYNTGHHRETDYLWWKKRLCRNAAMYDAIRIDHFRAFADYYAIKSGSRDAENGVWKAGFGIEFWESVRPLIASTEIIAEDLGGETKEVRELVRKTGFPDMKVLQFAFNSNLKNQFLPENYSHNCFCYTGTHDNDTTLGWYKGLSQHEKMLFSLAVPKTMGDNPVLNLIAYGMMSNAKTVIIPMQDYLCLDSDCRTNTPGTESGNWEWRLKKDYATAELKNTVKDLSDLRKKAKQKAL